MTKDRLALTPQEAVRVAARLLGWSRIAAIAGRSERTVRRWSEPDLHARLPFETALAIDLACREAGVGEPFAQCFILGRNLALSSACGSDVTACAAEAAREAGEAIAAQFELSSPGAGRRARRKAAKETREAIVAFSHTLAHLETIGAAA